MRTLLHPTRPRRSVPARRSGPGAARTRRRSACAFVLVACAACRDAPPPFSPGTPPDPSGELTWQVTFNPRDDRTPSWSPAGDTVFYSAEGYGDLPPTPGVLLAVPWKGGTATRILQSVQRTGAAQRWLTAPAPNGDRIAFVEVWLIWPRDVCIVREGHGPVSCTPDGAATRSPPLAEAVIRIRRYDEVGPVEADPELRFRFPGRVDDLDVMPSWHVIHFYPFQRLYDSIPEALYRPSWAPDGQRLVFSDGLNLRIWNPDADATPVIPGTVDAVWPAWSPDGEWIAYSRLERTDSTGAFCVHYDIEFNLACQQRRTEFTLGRAIVSLVRPDGSERVELGPGEHPAWGPDGRTLFFRRDDRIWRIAIDTGAAATPVPGTEGGREPAASPDGRHLAFTRLSAPGNHDVWITTLDPPSR